MLTADFDPLAETRAKLEKDRADQLNASLNHGLQFDPAKRASERKTAKELGVDVNLVSDATAEYDRVMKLKRIDPSSLVMDAPITARMLSTFKDAEILHGDVESLKAIEAAHKKVNTGFGETLLGSFITSSNRMGKGLTTDLSRLGEAVQGPIMKTVAEGIDKVLGTDTEGYLSKQFGLHEQFRQQVDKVVFEPGTVLGTEMTNPDRWIASSVGGAAPDIIAGWATAGFGPLVIGGTKAAAGAGLVRRLGVYLLNRAPQIMAQTATSMPSVLSSEADEYQQANPGADRVEAVGKAAVSSVAQSILEGLVEVPTIDRMSKARSVAQRLTGLFMSAQMEGAEEIAQRLTSQALLPDPSGTRKLTAQDLFENYRGGAVAGLVFGAGATKAPQMTHTEKFLTALHDEKARMKFVKDAPDVLGDFVTQLTQGGPVENLYVKAETWQRYFQEQGLTPAEAREQAQVVGVDPIDYDVSLKNGGELQVSTAKVAEHIAGTEHFQGLVGQMSPRLDAPTFADAQQAAAVNLELQAKAQELPETPELLQIRDLVAGQLKEAWPELGPKNAEDMALAHAKVLTVFAEKAKMAPLQLYEQEKVKIFDAAKMQQEASNGTATDTGRGIAAQPSQSLGQRAVESPEARAARQAQLDAIDAADLLGGGSSIATDRTTQTGEITTSRLGVTATYKITGNEVQVTAGDAFVTGLVVGDHLHTGEVDGADSHGIGTDLIHALVSVAHKAFPNLAEGELKGVAGGRTGAATEPIKKVRNRWASTIWSEDHKASTLISDILAHPAGTPMAFFQAPVTGVDRTSVRLARSVVGRLTKNTLPAFTKAMKAEGVKKADFQLLFDLAQNKEMVGAPPTINTLEARQKLVDKFEQMALEGEAGRFWYDDSAKAFLSAAGGDHLAAMKMAALAAVYSPKTPVPDNGRRGILAYYDAMHQKAISVGGIHPKVKESAQKIMDAKTLEEVAHVFDGQKVDSFQQNLIDLFAPEHANQDVATIDIWMMRAAGFDSEAPSGPQYKWVEQVVREVAAELGWKPKEAQAAIWIAQKAKTKGTDTKAAAFHYGDAISKIAAGVNIESMPGSSVRESIFPNIANATEAQLVQYHAEKVKVVEQVLRDAGFLLSDQTTGHGYWEGESNPVTSFQIPIPHVSSESTHTMGETAKLELELAAKVVMSVVQDQDAIGTLKPFWTTKVGDANGMHFALTRELTRAEMIPLAGAFYKLGLPAFIDGSDAKNLKFVAYEWEKNPKAAKLFHNALTKVMEDVLPEDVKYESHLFGGVSSLVTEGVPDGEGRIQGLSAERSSAIRDAIARGRSQVAHLNARVGTEFGWGSAAVTRLNQAPAAPHAVTVQGVHFSPQAGLDALDSAMYGTGSPGAERARLAGLPAGDPLRHRIHLYVDGPAVRKEGTVQGSNRYGAEVGNLYPLEADPAGLRAQANGDPFPIDTSLLVQNEDGKATAQSKFMWEKNYRQSRTDPISVVKLRGGKFYVLDGYHRIEQARRDGRKTLSAHLAAVDQELLERLRVEGVPAESVMMDPNPLNIFERSVLEAGYSGYVSPRPGQYGSVVLLGPASLDVVRLGQGEGETLRPVRISDPKMRDWFGLSRGTVDGKPGSNPRIYYHGTSINFESFRAKGPATGNAMFFSTEPGPNGAGDYALSSAGRIIPVYLKIMKPFDFREKKSLQDYAKYLGLTKDRIELWQGDPEAEMYIVASRGAWDFMESEDFQKFLADRGYDSFMTMENGAVHVGVLSPLQVKSAISNTGEFSLTDSNILHQPDSSMGRGYLEFGPPRADGSRRFDLGLLDKDRSTVFHEFGHLYLEIMGDLAAMEQTDQGLKDDYAKILKWFGVSERSQITTAMHEQFADAHLVYLKEGKAPTSDLARSFKKFSAWLTKIGKQLLGVNVPMNDEVRGVFDRLYASDEAIELAKTELFPNTLTTADMLGLSKAEFAALQRNRAEYLEGAKAVMVTQLFKEMEAQQTKERKAQRARIEEEVRTEAMQRPEYQALHTLSTGDMKIAEAVLLPEEKALLDKLADGGPKAYTRTETKGMDLDAAAMLTGFDTHAALMEALSNTVPLSELVQKVAEQRMVAEHGDPMSPAALKKAAVEALTGERMGEILATELRAYTNKARELKGFERVSAQEGTKTATTLPKVAEFRATAQHYISNLPIARIEAGQYLRLAKKFGNESYRAALKNDYEGAVSAKEREILNHFLHLEAVKALKAAESFRAWTKRNDSATVRSNLGKAGGSFLAQFDALRDRYEIERTSNKALERKATLAQWAEAMTSNHEDTAISDWLLDESDTRNYRELTPAQMQDLHDALKNIKHLAYRVNEMLIDGKRHDFGEAINQIVSAGYANVKGSLKPILRANAPETELRRHKILASLANADSSMVKIELLMNWIDGHDVNGPAHTYIWNRLRKAQTEMYDKQIIHFKSITDALEAMPKAQRHSMDESFVVPGMGNMKRSEILTMLLYYGQETRRAKLIEGYPELTEAAVLKAFTHLNAEDAKFANAIWAEWDKLRPEILDLEQRLKGVRPEWEQALPFKLRDADGKVIAEMTGGYFPLVMDPKAPGEIGKKQEGGTLGQLFDNNYARASTSQGHTKELTGATYPLLLDYSNILAAHLANQIKDLTYREAVLDINRILKNTDFQKMVIETIGPQYEAQLMPWLVNIVNDGNAGASLGMSAWNHFATALRGAASTAVIGMKYTSTIVQVMDIGRVLTPGPYAVSKGQFLRAVAQVLSNPVATTRWVREISGFMRHRAENLERDMRGNFHRLRGDESFKAAWNRNGWKLFGAMDALVSIPAWVGSYNQALKANPDEAAAILKADQTVSMLLMSGQPMDLATIQSDRNPWWKLATMFMGDASNNYNILRNAGHNIEGLKGIPTFTLTAALLMGFAIMAEYVKGMGPDDEEDKVSWWLRKGLLSPFQTVPLLREGVSVFDAVLAGKPWTDFKFSPAFVVMQKAANAGASIKKFSNGDEEWPDMTIKIGEALGYGFGISGTAQLTASTKYLRRYQQGEENPSNPAQLAADTIRGKRKERP